MFPISVTARVTVLAVALTVSENAEPRQAATSLRPPPGEIPVAFLLSEGATVIDFTGPWEVFQDASPGGGRGFRLYTVAETREPIHTSGGMTIVPEFAFEDAPTPRVIVIPAQRTRSDAARAWIRSAATNADVVMSVCTGAFLLASTGLLDGQSATTHHEYYADFAQRFPRVRLQEGRRFVENGKMVTAGGLTSGIDLALRVVERYYGHAVAEQTAFYMEYQGGGWRDASGASNAVYAGKPKAPATSGAHE
jgi:transcriptional regulator GlxA family with amidase domain